MSRRLHYLGLLILLCFSAVTGHSQTTVQIGTGTEIPGNTLYGPLYRYSASSTTTAARSNILYTAAEMAAAGISPGAIITAVAFHKTNAASFNTPCDYTMYMANTNNTSLATSLTWASVLASHTQVFTDPAFNVPNAPGWVTWSVTPFVYTGGALEIATSHTMGGNGAATDEFNWEYTAGLADQIVGVTNSTGTTLNGTVSGYKQRPNIQITYLGGSPCTSPPTAGVLSSSQTAAMCLGTPIVLQVTGGTSGSGQTYQLEESLTPGGPYTPSGSPQVGPSFIVSPTVTTYYRVAVICSGMTDYTNEVVSLINPAFPGGTYTINSAQATGGSNFQSFADAMAALNCGISGPVVFNVVAGSGPYNEKVVIPEILGASSTNTVSINGNGNLVEYTAAVTGDRGIITLDGADHITIDGLNVSSGNGSYGIGILLTNSADSNVIKNCTITTDLANTGSNWAGISMSGSKSSSVSSGSNCDDNLIENNTVIGGYYGISMYTTSGNIVRNNEVRDFYLYGIYNNVPTNSLVEGNNVHRPTRSTVSAFYGIHQGGAASGTRITRNRLHDPFSGTTTPGTSVTYPIYFSSSDAAVGSESLVDNNIMYALNGGGTIAGIYNSGSNNVHYYHNTIAIDDAGFVGSQASRGFYQTTSASGIRFHNNNVYIIRGGSGDNHGIYINTAATTWNSDNNNYFINGSGTNYTGRASSTDRVSVADWNTATGEDAASVSETPMFVDLAGGDLTPTNFAIDDKGQPLNITYDFNNAPRSTTTPDIGAYEFSVPVCVGTPNPGTATVDATDVCPNGQITLSLTGFTIGAGISIQWEESIPGLGMWMPVTGANTPIYSHTQTSGMEYRAVVTCANGGSSDVSNTVTVLDKPAAFCYCSPLSGVPLHGTTSNIIQSVVLQNTSLDVSTTAAGPGGYTQHDPSVATNTASLTQNQTYTLDLSSSSATYVREMWIDWDQNGSFDATEYIQLPAGSFISENITVPVNAVPGLTGMRIRALASSTASFGAAGACDNVSTGRETEDFIITIVAAPTCAGVPSNTGTPTVTQTSVCYGGAAELGLDNIPTELGLTFQWQESPAGQNTWTDITGATNFTHSLTNLTASMDYRMQVTCTNGAGGTAFSTPVSVTVTNPQVLTTAPATRCGYGTLDLGATSDAGTFVAWFDQSTGGTVLDTGVTFTTPMLGSNTTYYAAAMLPGQPTALGKPAPTTAINLTGAPRGLIFDAHQSFNLISVTVYSTAAAAGTGTIELRNSAGNVIAGPVNVTWTGGGTPANPIANVLTLNLPVPAGTGHRLVMTSVGSGIAYETAGFNGNWASYSLPGVVDLTASMSSATGTSTTAYYYFYDWQISTICEGARVPVTATVNAAPAITLSATDDTICVGSSATLNVSSANAGYTYTWTPGGTGSSITVSPATTTSYYLEAVDGNNCVAYDTIEVAVVSAPATLVTLTDVPFVCQSGNATLTLDPQPMAGLTYQWQKNLGAGFVDIPGATNVSHTEAITASADYRAQVFCNNALVAVSDPVAVGYSNPAILQTFPGSRCDAGEVALAAIAEPGSEIAWYDDLTATTPVGTGGAFVTPSINSTTTWYAAARSGYTMQQVGPVNPDAVSTSGGFTNLATYRLFFTVNNGLILQSVDIFPGTAGGSGTIEIYTSNDVLVSTTPFTAPAGGSTTTGHTVTLSTPLTPGDYYIKMGTAISIYRNTNGSAFPYSIPELSITGHSFNGYPQYYYYFYNWQVLTACEGTRVPVTASINGTTSGTGLSTGGTVTGTLHADGATVNYTDGCGDVVATVEDAPGGNTLGITSAIVLTTPTVQTFNNNPYVSRIVDLDPSSEGPATVTLYATQAEFNAYNAYVTANNLSVPMLPTGPADMAGIANIVVTQYHGSALDSNTGPGGLYDSTSYSFIPNSSITASWNGNYWTMTFPVTGFSGFFIHSGSSPLTIELQSIKAANVGHRNRVDWTTASEDAGDYFIVQRSKDGRNFSDLGTVAGNGSAAAYSYWDEQPFEGLNYYRLKMISAAGEQGYSTIVTATMKGSANFAMEAFPNPVQDRLNVRVTGGAANGRVLVTDVAGKTIKAVEVKSEMVTVDLSDLAQGMYLIQYTDDLNSKTIKVNKQ